MKVKASSNSIVGKYLNKKRIYSIILVASILVLIAYLIYTNSNFDKKNENNNSTISKTNNNADIKYDLNSTIKNNSLIANQTKNIEIQKNNSFNINDTKSINNITKIINKSLINNQTLRLNPCYKIENLSLRNECKTLNEKIKDITWRINLDPNKAICNEFNDTTLIEKCQNSVRYLQIIRENSLERCNLLKIGNEIQNCKDHYFFRSGIDNKNTGICKRIINEGFRNACIDTVTLNVIIKNNNSSS